jgi:hypothetical protein
MEKEPPDKLSVQLVPRDKEASDLLNLHNFNPKLQYDFLNMHYLTTTERLTLKSKKSVAYILDYLNGKWVVDVNGQQVHILL